MYKCVCVNVYMFKSYSDYQVILGDPQPLFNYPYEFPRPAEAGNCKIIIFGFFLAFFGHFLSNSGLAFGICSAFLAFF